MDQIHYSDPSAALDLQRLYKSSKLLPFFGSGFTKGLRSKSARVPDAKQLTQKITEIASGNCRDPEDAEAIRKINDLKIAFNLLFDEEYVQPVQARTYLSNVFSDVIIADPSKVSLLQLNWPHILTFNIDDAIESVARGYKKLLPNKEVAREYITSNKCLFKIHGDIEDLCAYTDQRTIFTWSQYIESINENKSMLSFVKQQAETSAFLFIGCSLDTELDLLSLAKDMPFSKSILLKRGRAGVEEKLALKQYGIQQVIYFDDYDEISIWVVSTLKDTVVDAPRSNLYIDDTALSAKQAIEIIANGGPLSKVESNQIKGICSSTFPRRDLVSEVARELRTHDVVLIVGRRFSGKTMLLYQVLSNVLDYSSSYYSTTDTFSPEVAQLLSVKKNHVFAFDSNYLNAQALDSILHAKLDPSNRIIICVGFGDADLMRIRLEDKNINYEEVEIHNKLRISETQKFNENLANLGLPKYQTSNTLLNFSYNYFKEYESQLGVSSLFKRKFNNSETKVLILIAAFGKADFAQVHAINENFDINNFISNNDRLLEAVSNKGSTATNVIVCNSSSWLLQEMQIYFGKPAVARTLADIISSLSKEGFKVTAKNLISFDKLNEVSGGKGFHQYIREMYKLIQANFQDDNHYWIQRAKCELISGSTVEDFKNGMLWVSKIRVENSTAKNQTYYSATLVKAQLHARAYKAGADNSDLLAFLENMHESAQNYQNNKTHIDRLLDNAKPDTLHAVKSLESVSDARFLTRRTEVTELLALFQSSKENRKRARSVQAKKR
ncbi:TPA: AVAST type 5 anti-phage protein Avs5 [Pseudomonas aeruginosa]|nr:SIR2 family protein [Pseudomonas aeruginosa]